MERTDNRRPLYVTIDDNIEGVGLLVTVSMKENTENREITEEEEVLQQYQRERRIVPSDAKMLAYVLAEVIRENPGYVPDIRLNTVKVESDQFFRAYQKQIREYS